jgi:TolB-like protein
MSLFAELKRRNVFRVGIAYVVVSWVMLQVADVMIDNMDAPAWLFRSLLMAIGVGFPITLIVAWAYELTPEGLKRDNEIDRSQASKRPSGRKLDFVIIALLAVGLVYFFWESRLADDVNEPAGSRSTQAASAPAAVSVSDRSVAVLPFINMSSDPEQEYFSDGITEEIINAVVKIPGISVPARTSVFGYKGHQGDIRAVGVELGVAHVLEGSIRSQGDQVRITAQLIKVDDGFHLWSDTFDRRLENIFAVQEEIAAAIAKVLIGELGIEVATVPNQTRNMQAYDLYLQGRALLRQRDESAVGLFEQAIEADSNFAPAYAALAITLQSTGIDNDRAIAEADRALAIDPDNVDALDAKASALRTRGQWLASEALFDKALAIDPASAELLEDYTEFLGYTGRVEEGLVASTRGMQIDQHLRPLAMAHIEMLESNSRNAEAREVAAEVLSRGEGNRFAWWAAIPVWLSPASDPQALTPPQPETDEDWPDTTKNTGGFVDSITENRLSDEQLASLLETHHRETPDRGQGTRAWWTLGDLLMAAGEVDAVIQGDLARLESGGTSPGPLMREFIWSPLYTEYRRHPDFLRLLEATGLVDYWDATEWPKWCQRDDAGVISCQ